MCGDVGRGVLGVMGGISQILNVNRKKYDTKIYESAALEAEERAKAITLEGEKKKKALRREASQQEGQARSLLASSGVALDSITSQDQLANIATSSAQEIADEDRRTRYNAKKALYDAKIHRHKASLLAADNDQKRFQRMLNSGFVIGNSLL